MPVLWLVGYLPATLAQTEVLADIAAGRNGESPGTPQLVGSQRDILDIVRTLAVRYGAGRRIMKERDTTKLQNGRPLVWIIPQVGYSRQTGLLGQVLGNVAFRRPFANVSTQISTLSYTANNQQILTSMLNYWTAHNTWNLTTDMRLMHYPQATYGLGMYTTTDRIINMDYQYLRSYVTLLRRLASNLYGGLGMQLDLHWGIDSYDDRRERLAISRYPFGVSGRSVAAGPTLNLLYDNRPNSINTLQGFYANLVFRQNLTRLGSDRPSQLLQLDVRKYVSLSASRPETVLAFWSYNALTLSGNPPFLDLPATGWDISSNTGRGYIQGRFRGKDLLYAEAELRFGITADRLLGGVVFVNAQTVSQPYFTRQFTDSPHRFERVAPAAGLGLRLRMNKLSRTNLAIDYAFGIEGSQGVYFNLGEVF
ncbi:BamA/TamA family outer membrane protein [Nibrella viscosa]